MASRHHVHVTYLFLICTAAVVYVREEDVERARVRVVHVLLLLAAPSRAQLLQPSALSCNGTARVRRRTGQGSSEQFSAQKRTVGSVQVKVCVLHQEACVFCAKQEPRRVTRNFDWNSMSSSCSQDTTKFQPNTFHIQLTENTSSEEVHIP